MKTLMCATTMTKAKYIKKVPDGKGGWKYDYPDDQFGRLGKHRAKQASHLAGQASEGTEKHDVSEAMRGSKLKNATSAHQEARSAHSIAAEHHKKIGNKDSSKHHNDMAFEHDQKLRKLKRISKAVLLVTMAKAKYIKKVPDGKGGWKYLYEHPGEGATGISTGRARLAGGAKESHKFHEAAQKTSERAKKENTRGNHMSAIHAHGEASEHFGKITKLHRGLKGEAKTKEEKDRQHVLLTTHENLAKHHDSMVEKHEDAMEKF